MTPGRTMIPKAYGFVILSCICYASWNMLGLGFMVGGQRSAFIDKARKNGDEKAELRFGLPNLYAEGLSKEAIAFNNLQRGHQQPLETLTAYMLTALIGGVCFPITVAFLGLLWNIARIEWAEGYAVEAKKRYRSSMTYFVWVSLVHNMTAAFFVSLHIIGFVWPPLETVKSMVGL